MVERQPLPLVWHPSYLGRPELLDWLNNTGEDANPAVLELPMPSICPLRVNEHGRITAVRLSRRNFTLTRRAVTAPAPFTGDPRSQSGTYEWQIATDDVGRSIASEAELVISSSSSSERPV